MERRKFRVPAVCSGWKVWKCPGLIGLGTWSVYVERSGAVVSRYTKSGLHLGTRYVRFQTADVESQSAEFYGLVENMMKRREKVVSGLALTPHAAGDELLERWPTLAGWMTDPAFDDGSERRSGWFGVSCRDGLWTVMMKDNGEALELLLSAPSPLRLLDLMEHALTSPDAPWRHDPKAKEVVKKKK